MTVIILYINLDVLLQIIFSENKISIDLLKKKFMKMIFNIYMTLVISTVYFPFTIAWGEHIKYKRPNIHIVLWEGTIGMYKKDGLDVVIKNIGGNLLLLAPMIFFLCYYLNKIHFNVKRVLIISFFISLFIECSQVTLSVIIPNYSRTFDTMDLLCNSISGLIGYGLYLFYKRIVSENIELEDSSDVV
ncbi:VanZ family protein [Clostridium sp.]|uniref:VanZ family protein n=1 Tax=Clostridium sp. TaxID=1506 RepID=UPI0025C56D0A|nr:VanZ family protein [Clostridium sp.]MCI9303197.1 VanZ family protein [Clostridium sp.]